jgi:orotate phosphoribosyltransferase
MPDNVQAEVVRSGLVSQERVDRFVRKGHFVYESGDHGDVWLDLDVLFSEPARMRRASQTMANAIKKYNAEIVVAPALGGALAGQMLADTIGSTFVYAERFGRVGNVRYAIPAGTRPLVSGKRILVVDDVINAGSATLATLEEVRSCGGTPVAIAAFMIRKAAQPDVAAKAGIPVESMIALDWNIWKAAQCPVCES